MGLNCTEEKKKEKFEKKDLGRIKKGTYIAIPYQIIDLGRQYETDYRTGEKITWDDGNPKIYHKVWITFEFPTERVEWEDKDGEVKEGPRVLGKKYTVSTHEKAALTGLFEAAGKPGATNIGELLGCPVLVNVGSTSGDRAKVVSVSAVVSGMQVPNSELDTVVFDMDEFDHEVFKSLPKFIQDIIRESLDWDEVEMGEPVNGEDVPF